jgi:hypothetical protein
VTGDRRQETGVQELQESGALPIILVFVLESGSSKETKNEHDNENEHD